MTIHNALLVVAVAAFAFDAWQNPPSPTRLTCVGLALFAASFIVWAL